MDNQFNSNANKGLLWNLMNENNLFHNISGEKLEEIKQLFENNIKQINNSNEPLKEKNKKILLIMSQELNTYRSNSYEQRIYNGPITSDEISQQRQKNFEQNLEKRQNEFNNLLAVKVPNAPDFSDSKIDRPIGEEMDNLLNDAIARREYDLRNAMNNHNKTEAKDWLSSTPMKNNSNNTNNNNEIRLNIGEKITTPISQSITVPNMISPNNPYSKRVSFEEPTENTDLFNKFKQINSKIDDSIDSKEYIIKRIKQINDDIKIKSGEIDKLLTKLEKQK